MRKAWRRLRAADRRDDGAEDGDVNGEISTSGIARSSEVVREGMIVVDCRILGKRTECWRS